MNIDKIIKVDISIAEQMTINGGYDTILLIGPLPKSPGGKSTPDVAGYASTAELKSVGFVEEDPIYIAASKIFSQSPSPSIVFVAVQKLVSSSTEPISDTLDRALGVPGWYCVCPAGIKENFYQSIADWVEANEQLSIMETTGISASPVSDGMFRTGIIHATNENDCTNAAYAARFLSYDPGSEAWAYKQLAAVEAQSLSTQDIMSLENRNISYYIKVAGTNMVCGGKTAAGEWIDTIRFRDWLKTRIQEKGINLLLSLPKVAYTDKGIGLFQNAVSSALDEGVSVGGIAEPENNEDGSVTPSYTITVPKAAELDAQTRKSRRLTGIKWSARLAGAILISEIDGTLNY